MRQAVKSKVTLAWNESVARGEIEHAAILERDVQLCGRTIPKNSQIRAGLTTVNGEPAPFAQVVGGDPLAVEIVSKHIGDFIIVRSDLRGIRPGAPKDPAIGRQPDFVSPGVTGCKFECREALTPLSLRHRIPLLEMRLRHGTYAVFANANFFEVRGHVLLVPTEQMKNEREYPHRPQRLSLSDLEDLLYFQEQNSDQLAFYNSIHAGATVDHIHGQSIYNCEKLAIEKAPLNRIGEVMVLAEEYPVRGLVFVRSEAPITVYKYVDRCQNRGIPFNLIVSGEKIFLIPRNRNHEVLPQFPAGVFASMELAGKIITHDKAVFESLTLEKIVDALELTTLKDFEVLLHAPE